MKTIRTFFALALLLPSLALADYTAKVLEDSPVLLWLLDESSGATATDSSGNGRDGTYNGSVAYSQTGAIAVAAGGGTAVKADANTKFVSRVSESATNFGTGAFSSECWIKMAAGGNFSQFLCKTDGGNDGWCMDTDGGGNAGMWINTSQPSWSANAHQLSTGTWFYVLITRSGTSLHRYMRCTDSGASCYTAGLLDETASIPGGVSVSSTANVRLFYESQFGGGAPNFTLDNCALYSTALSSARAAAHFNCGYDGTGCSGSPMRRRIFESGKLDPENWFSLARASIDDFAPSVHLNTVDGIGGLLATGSGG